MAQKPSRIQGCRRVVDTQDGTDMENLKVMVAVHKPYDVLCDGTYLPIQVGAALAADLGIGKDNTGINISEKNGFYCELTALYWAWHNLPADALGLMHYRRYLGMPGRCVPWKRPKEKIASGEELRQCLEKAPIILPKKRNYVIENRENQYVRAHGRAGMDALRAVLKRQSPEYLPAFDRTMKRTSGHCFNIFIMRRDLCDAYCQWLFGTLFEVEAVMRASMPEDVIPRLFGFLAERMLDCWIETQGLDYVELPVVNMEPQRWIKKGAAFLLRKYGLNPVALGDRRKEGGEHSRSH